MTTEIAAQPCAHCGCDHLPADAPRAAAYGRISDDREGREWGVTDQDADIAELACREGLRIVAKYRDNDIGASTRSRKERPDYKRMIADAKAGKFEVILGATSNRVTRHPLEFHAQVELAEDFGIRYLYVKSPEFDLNTAAGRGMARMLASIDTMEAEVIAERVARARKRQALDGRFGGGQRRFGMTTKGVVDETEAAEIRTWVDAVLAGVSLSQIARDANQRGILPTRAAKWNAVGVRNVLLQPRLAGLVVHQGAILEGVDAAWGAIVDREKWEAVCALLRDEARRTHKGTAPRWLGSGIYLCGHADCADKAVGLRIQGPKRRRAYACVETQHIRRTQLGLDDYVVGLLTDRLARPDAIKLLANGSAAEIGPLVDKAAAIGARIAEATDLWQAGVLPKDDLVVRVKELNAERDAIDRLIDNRREEDLLAEIAGKPDAAERWERFDLGRQRAILSALLRVTVLPEPRGGRREPGKPYFNSDYIATEWLR